MQHGGGRSHRLRLDLDLDGDGFLGGAKGGTSQGGTRAYAGTGTKGLSAKQQPPLPTKKNITDNSISPTD